MSSKHLITFITAVVVIGLVFLFAASIAIFLLPLIVIFAVIGLIFGRRPARIVRINYDTPPDPAREEDVNFDDTVIDIKAQEVEPERQAIEADRETDRQTPVDPDQ